MTLSSFEIVRPSKLQIKGRLCTMYKQGGPTALNKVGRLLFYLIVCSRPQSNNSNPTTVCSSLSKK